MRAHIIEGGKVANTIEVESLDFMPGLVDAELGGEIGDLFDGSVFSKPEPPELSADERRAAIQDEIDALERQDLAGRFVRESLLVFGADMAERMAEKMTAAGQPTTKEQVLAATPGYQKALALNERIVALRALRAIIV